MRATCVRCGHPPSFHGHKPGRDCGAHGCLCPGWIETLAELDLSLAQAAELIGCDPQEALERAAELGGVQLGEVEWRFDRSGVTSKAHIVDGAGAHA